MANNKFVTGNSLLFMKNKSKQIILEINTIKQHQEHDPNHKNTKECQYKGGCLHFMTTVWHV